MLEWPRRNSYDARFAEGSTRLRIVGLTGGIASGKSTAATLLGELGAHIIDADVLGHQAYDPGTSAFRTVVKTFGEDIVADDGTIDRRALGSKVFGNSDALTRLTDIVWPEIRRLAELEIRKVGNENPTAVIVLEAAVLLEAGWDDIADVIWVVVVDPEIAIERAMQRDGADRAAIEARIARAAPQGDAELAAGKPSAHEANYIAGEHGTGEHGSGEGEHGGSEGTEGEH